MGVLDTERDREIDRDLDLDEGVDGDLDNLYVDKPLIYSRR